MTADVRVVGVSKRFTLRGRPDPVVALDDVSFEIEQGEIVSLLGPSGCGKTTLLRIVLGLERATAGRVEVRGTRVIGPGRDRGMVFQHADLLPWRTALENVAFGLEAQHVPSAERRVRAMRYLDLVGLADAADRHPSQLSGGMAQRVGIARALAIEPVVLLMDEPFGALDAQARELMQSELLRIHAETGKTILFVTHDIDEAILLSDRVVVLSSGPGRIRDIVPIDIPRPRVDVAAIRGGDEFQRKRYTVWLLLREPHRALRAS